MSDLISRQAAIDAIEESRRLNHHLDAKAASCHEYEHRHFIKILSELPSAQPEQRWIPCSERLPEESGQYLTTVKYKHVDGYEDVYAEHGEWYDGSWDMFSFGHCGEVEDIIAWQPLPEPYKWGRKEEK